MKNSEVHFPNDHQAQGNIANKVRRAALSAFAFAVFFPIFALTGPLLAEDANHNQTTKVFSPDASIFGKGLDDWSAEWQKWFISIPASQNPALDNGPCSTAQSGPVWFIPSGSGVTRQCTVLTGKLLLITLINAECSNVEALPFFGATEHTREECAETLIDGVSTRSLLFTIDGQPVRNLSRYRVQSPQYHFSMPATDNVLGVTSGATSGVSVSDGYFVMVQLAPGHHVLRFAAAIVSGPGAGFSQDVTYDFIQL
jgi:hypothetical protein